MAMQPGEEVTQVQVLEVQRGHPHSCEGGLNKDSEEEGRDQGWQVSELNTP